MHLDELRKTSASNVDTLLLREEGGECGRERKNDKTEAK